MSWAHFAPPVRSHWWRRFGALALIGTALLLTGCPTSLRTWARQGFKLGPNYGRPPAPVADEWVDAEDPGVRTEQTSYACWWAVFNDPQLNRLVAAASRQNLTLGVAGLRILEARHQLGIAAGNLFPQQQQAYGSVTRNKISTSNIAFDIPFPIEDRFTVWRGGFDAAWELDIWGKYRRAIEAANANMNAQIENFDDVLVMLQAEVAANYIQMRTFEERLEYARTNVRLQQETLKIIEVQLEAGAGNELDLQQARSDLANTEAAIPALEVERRRAENRLCVLLGLPPGSLEAELVGAPRVPAAPTEAIVGIPADLLRRRPDVRRAEREAAAQSARIGIAESDLYPQFTITGTIGLEAREFSELWKSESLVGSVGPGFRWNILNYGRILHNVGAEEARFQQAVLRYQQTVLQANEEVENGLVGFLREQVRMKSLGESVEATQKAYELSLFAYERGAVDYERLLDSQRALVFRQDALAESRGRVALNLVAVYKAVGGGWETRLLPRGARMVRRIAVAPPGTAVEEPAPEPVPPPQPETDEAGENDPPPVPPLPAPAPPAGAQPVTRNSRLRVEVVGSEQGVRP